MFTILCFKGGAQEVQKIGPDSSIYMISGDTLELEGVVVESKKPDKIYSPKKAAMLSAAFPGLGQIYNRKYWKLPIVYGGLAALGYSIYWNNKYYVYYTNAYYDFVDDDPTTNRWTQFIDPETIEGNTGAQSQLAGRLENKKDSYRRDRDYMIILTIGMYVLNIIDASVDAHLSDFDISKDLSLRVEPQMKFNEVNHSHSLGMVCKFRF